MIKRNWFISIIAVKDGEKILSWRVFDQTSFFVRRSQAIEFIIGKIASDLGVESKYIAVTAFNRV